MNRKNILPGMILIGLGLFFLLQRFELPIIDRLFTWPTLLFVIGIAFLAQGYTTDSANIVPGFILTGLGIHFHAAQLLRFWPNHWAVYTFIVGIAYLLRFQKTKTGLLLAVILLIISLLGFFYEGIIQWISYVGAAVGWLESFWPILLILIGIYILCFKK